MSVQVWRRNDGWIGAELEDNFVMVNVDTGFYVTLNTTARAIWKALELPATETEIAALLIERFDVSPEQCQASVARALEKMRELKLAHSAGA